MSIWALANVDSKVARIAVSSQAELRKCRVTWPECRVNVGFI